MHQWWQIGMEHPAHPVLFAMISIKFSFELYIYQEDVPESERLRDHIKNTERFKWEPFLDTDSCRPKPNPTRFLGHFDRSI